MCDVLQAELRIHYPLPYQACDNEGHALRIQKYRAQRTLCSHSLVKRNRQKQAENKAPHNEQNSVHYKVTCRYLPTLISEQSLILIESNEIVHREHFRRGERNPDRPRHRADVHENSDQCRWDEG